MTSDVLSDRQRDLLEFIRAYIAEHSYPPSVREMRDICGISSTSVVHYNLDKLEARGRIKRDHNVARGITVLR